MGSFEDISGVQVVTVDDPLLQAYSHSRRAPMNFPSVKGIDAGPSHGSIIQPLNS